MALSDRLVEIQSLVSRRSRTPLAQSADVTIKGLREHRNDEEQAQQPWVTNATSRARLPGEGLQRSRQVRAQRPPRSQPRATLRDFGSLDPGDERERLDLPNVLGESPRGNSCRKDGPAPTAVDSDHRHLANRGARVTTTMEPNQREWSQHEGRTFIRTCP